MQLHDAHSFYMQGTNGKAVILVHGLTGAPAEMKFVGKQLNRAGFSVYAPTLAGHCVDIPTLVATRYEDWTLSLAKAIDDTAAKYNEIYMAGICVGGALALYAAHQDTAQHSGRVKGVAIYSPLFNYDGWNTPFYYKWAPRGIPLMMRIPFIRDITFGEAPPYGIKSDRVRKAVMGGGEGIAGTLPCFPAKSLYQNYRLNDALKKALPSIHIPTLLIHAKEDDVGHPRNATRMHALHGGPCELVWLEDSYHLIHVDQERHKVAKLTAEFFGVKDASDAPAEAA